MSTSTHPYTVTNEMVDDILCAALEGGINYWAVKASPTVPPQGDLFASDMLTRGANLRIVDFDGGKHTLTLANMKAGIRKAAAHYGQTVEAFYEDHDAGAADTAVQFALFGELVYA